MNALKTTAIVEDDTHLRLDQKINILKQGTQVEIVIFTNKTNKRPKWKQILSEIGTYTDEELSGFSESRKEFNKWIPKEF